MSDAAVGASQLKIKRLWQIFDRENREHMSPFF
jgi:hypothetical protein